jgi:type IV secretion system protein VirD4
MSISLSSSLARCSLTRFCSHAADPWLAAVVLLGCANTLYLCAPMHEQERLRTVFSMLVQELLPVIYEPVAATRKPLDPPLLLLLDECANIAPIPNLAEIASTGADRGCSC